MRLAFLHVFKNGGTTLVDRYKHNSDFIYQRVTNEFVTNYHGNEQKVHPIDELTQDKFGVILGHGVRTGMAFDVEYATVLREPRSRIIGAYNYYRLECEHINKITTTIDFSTWFMNRDRLLPTPTYWQYQHFSNECSLGIDFGRGSDDSLQQDLLHQSLETMSSIDHVMFMDKDYVTQVDQLVTRCGLTVNLDVVHSHSSKRGLKSYQQEYYNELTASESQLIDDHIYYEQQFYDYFRNKFK